MCSALSTQMPREAVSARKVLALDTSTRSGSLALLEGEKLVGSLGLLSSDNHAERLLGCIDYLLSGAGWRLEQCGLIAVGIGPGSFTGIRIGVSTALGLAQTVGCPLSAVSGLDALAHAIATLVEGLAPRGLPPIGIVMDAGRGQVYHCEYRVRAGRLRRARKPSLRSGWAKDSSAGVLRTANRSRLPVCRRTICASRPASAQQRRFKFLRHRCYPRTRCWA